jgi:flavin reductase (DIM6/NTAB) family NADH-FMN oxidoreductase RutF
VRISARSVMPRALLTSVHSHSVVPGIPADWDLVCIYSESEAGMTTIDERLFRSVLGQYPTGVVIVTAHGPAGPLGMTVGSFTSVSIDPPLVAFLPSKASKSWQALRSAGDRFCINVLSAEQEAVCRRIATGGDDRFQGIGFADAVAGPIIHGCVAYVECEREAIIDAGDHEIVLGRVINLGADNPVQPLLFFRGGYGSFKPASMVAVDRELIGHLRAVDMARPHMERLAETFSTQVNVSVAVDDTIIITASVGRTDAKVGPTRVGIRLPFMPPAGAVLATWGSEATKKRWLRALGPDVSDSLVDEFQAVLARVRERGYAVTFGRGYLEVESLAERALSNPDADPTEVRASILALASEYNPASLDIGADRAMHVISVPVFGHDNEEALFQLTMWGPERPLTEDEFAAHVSALKEAAEAATRSIRALAPTSSG